MISADQARNITLAPNELAFQDALQKNETIIKSAASTGLRVATLYDGPDRARMARALVDAGYMVIDRAAGCLRAAW